MGGVGGEGGWGRHVPGKKKGGGGRGHNDAYLGIVRMGGNCTIVYRYEVGREEKCTAYMCGSKKL